MRRPRLGRGGQIAVALGVIALTFAITSLTSTTAATSPCKFQTAPGANVAFCETFNAPAGTGNRSGQLNGDIWGVSRSSGDMNLDAGHANPWARATLAGCNGPQPAQPDGSDVIICNGQMREVTNDNGTVTVLAMYPKQPFDFTGRTGTAVFDVSDDTQGTHAAWPEFWITDQPTPAPFAHFGTWNSPRNGIGIRFAGHYGPANGDGSCAASATDRVGVDSAIFVSNWVSSDTAWTNPAGVQVQYLGCVQAASGPDGALNHVEMRFSSNQIDVFMSSPGSATLVQVARITGALPLTRGLIWLEDVHYNAIKGGNHTQATHTFTWDNVGFDGAYTYRDLSFDANDPLTSCHDGTLCLGWLVGSNNPLSLSIPGVNRIGNATSASLMFGFYSFNAPLSFTYSVNGHAHTGTWLYPDTQGFTSRIVSYPVPLSDLVTGTNTVTITGSDTMVVSNVNIVLVAAGIGGTGGTGGSSTSTPTSVAATPTVGTGATATVQAAFCTTAYYRNGVLTPGNPITCP
jgi:hypothetical protein